MSTQINNKPSQCRTCFINDSNEMTSIESLEEYSKDMSQLLKFLDLKVVENIPNVLCFKCVAQLQSILHFKNQCLYMRDMLITNFENMSLNETKATVKVEIIKVEPDDPHFEDDISDSDSEKPSSDAEEITLLTDKISSTKNSMKSDTEKETYQCTICFKKFQSVSNLAKHKALMHKLEENIFPCQLCRKTYYTHLDLERHISVFHDAICNVCNKKFSNTRYLRRHMSRHQTDKPKFFCDECKKFYANYFSYDSHKRRFHSKNPIPKTVCNLCGLMVYNLKHHMSRKHTVDNIKCEFCDKILKNQDSLRSHVRMVHENKGLNSSLCSTCGKVYRDLRLHIRMKHSNERKYKCQYCEKTYKTSSHQRKHERIEHLKKRPFKCDYCFRGFGTKGVLEGHIRTHTGEKPFVCEICTKAFTLKVTLTTHIKLVHRSELK